MDKIACLQMVSGPDVQANLQQAESLIEDAVAAGAKLIILPENFACMSIKDADKLKIMEAPGDGPIQAFLAKMANEHGIWLVGGSISLRTENPQRSRAAVLVFNSQGDLVARYDKMHLFDVNLPESDESYHESSTIEPGDEVVVVDTPFGRLGLCVCYDIRFPELFRLQLDKGMEILAVPSAFTAITGKAHWEALLTARAIENQCFVAAANQGGTHANGRSTYGHSMIIDPWGVILDRLPSASGIVIADIDRARLESTRKHFPAIKHRRLGGADAPR